MTRTHETDPLHAAFEPARRLEPTDAEVDAILSQLTAAAPARRRAPRALARMAAFAAVLLVALTAAYAVAPPVRAAIDELADPFAAWLGGDPQQAPGRPVAGDDFAPDYLRNPNFAKDPRVIAEAGGYKLFAARRDDGTLTFDLGNTLIGIGGSFAKDLREHALIVLGPGAMRYADRRGHVPLFGLVRRNVAHVELEYEGGPPLRVATPSGGFVLLAEYAREPRAVVAYGDSGHELERRRVDNTAKPCPCIDWSQYRPGSRLR